MQDGQYAGELRWCGEVLRMTDENGARVGSLYRSNGVRRGSGIAYTYRAYLTTNDAEVARGASLEDAVSSVLGG